MKIEDLRNKKILILGFGREGRDSFLFLRKLLPGKVIGIADKNEIKNLKPKIKNYSNVHWHLGKNYLSALNDYDVIIKSPGIPFKILPRPASKKIVTQTDIFFDSCPGTIVGVTGTKGKSTTAAMIYEILKSAGIKAHLAGNIGMPILSLLKSAGKKDLYVYELSSHQLYNLKKSPHVAVFLNLFREHLDYYKNFQEYARAKANITLHQTKNDYLVYNKRDKLVSAISAKSKAKKVPIFGEYYDLDRSAAQRVGEILNVPKNKINKAINQFTPLPHRLEMVGTFRGITFYDDALSTIPETAIFAIKFLGNKVETVLLGGYDRKADFDSLAKEILERKNIKNLIFFPTTGEKIWRAILSRGGGKLPKAFFADNMKDAVQIAYENTVFGKIVLMSCASTSFSIFKDYKEKGDLFKKFVKLFGKRK